MGCGDPPINKETVRPKKTEDDAVKNDEEKKEEQSTEADTFNEEETIKLQGCAIADPRDNQNSGESKKMCDGVTGDKGKEKTSYPWFKLCCKWDASTHECKPDTGQNSVAKGIFQNVF